MDPECQPGQSYKFKSVTATCRRLHPPGSASGSNSGTDHCPWARLNTPTFFPFSKKITFRIIVSGDSYAQVVLHKMAGAGLGFIESIMVIQLLITFAEPLYCEALFHVLRGCHHPSNKKNLFFGVHCCLRSKKRGAGCPSAWRGRTRHQTGRASELGHRARHASPLIPVAKEVLVIVEAHSFIRHVLPFRIYCPGSQRPLPSCTIVLSPSQPLPT